MRLKKPIKMTLSMSILTLAVGNIIDLSFSIPSADYCAFSGCYYIRFNRMAGEPVDESQFKGLSRYFNSYTNRGRANTAKATYAFFGVVILYFTLKPKKAAPAK
ncbi:ATP synthase membrane subunit DAPIT, mitochondrial [Zerene cesonia]|uniref:ATP synthase membrane subunit DAPIT, mitochondrial n=1 Tax=Zerene cesonia TaxID=33412 RepID=UPI0018E5035D|nr:ATP synthase membrane subunit DAPIT, mitochondrial [Zerene cesonia]